MVALHQVLVRCRPQLPHEAPASGGSSGGSRTPKPFTPRAMLPRPRSRTALERAGERDGGADSARSSLDGNAASPPATVVVHDAGDNNFLLPTHSHLSESQILMKVSPLARIRLQALR